MSRKRICVQTVFVAGLLLLRSSWAIFRVPDLDWNHVNEPTTMNWLHAVRYTDLCNSSWYRFSESVRSAAATNCSKAASLWRALPASKRITCDPDGSRCIRRSMFLGLATGHCAFRCSSGASSSEKPLRELVNPVPDFVNKLRARRFIKAATAKPKRGQQQHIMVDESIYPSSP